MILNNNAPEQARASDPAYFTSQLNFDEEFLERIGAFQSEYYIYAWTLRHNHGLDDHMLLGHVLAAVSRTAHERDNMPTIDGFRNTDPYLREMRDELHAKLVELREVARSVYYGTSSGFGHTISLPDPLGLTRNGDAIRLPVHALQEEAKRFHLALRHLSLMNIRALPHEQRFPSLSQVAWPMMEYWWEIKAEMPGTWRTVCADGRPALGTAAGLMADALHLVGWRFTLAELAPVYEAARQKLKREIKKVEGG
ncbi:hypothetical protein [Sphingobium yanoikuyae]|uniref:hypothetical protein n=1 Tax=Sphingobium yanoikuyae TaxID=13690 RepID=UPI000AB739F9|nr:hypothetical protein [Sphingobium yanoikuyae]MDV3480843.1 hypothetical protein [Sphingobium yanoikuyae]